LLISPRIQKNRKELSKKTKTTPKISSTVEEQQKDAVDDTPVEDVPTSKQLSFLQGPLPDLLPEDFLDDSAEAGQLIRFSPDDDLPRMKAKKTKFEPIVEKAPKDLRIGNTTYRVIKPSSANLAPKSAHNARSTKESWLHGRVGKTIATNRKPINQGFFRK
jgi:U3 small nucleolar RNA-associated protein 16